MSMNIDLDGRNVNPEGGSKEDEDVKVLSVHTEPALYDVSEKGDLTRKLYYGCVTIIFVFVTLLILAAALEMTHALTIVFTIIIVLIFVAGQFVPRSPWSPNHRLEPSKQMLAAEMFYFGMLLFFVWSWIAGIVSFAYVDDFIEDYCKECIEDDCGCDEMCEDDEDSLKTLSYVFIAISILIASCVAIIYARWTARLATILEREFPGAVNAGTKWLHVVNLPNLDPACCCCCPGRQQTCYDPKKWKDAADDLEDNIKDAASDATDNVITVCENIWPFVCCTLFIASYVFAGVICYGNSTGWFQVACCVYFFICYVFLEIGANS